MSYMQIHLAKDQLLWSLKQKHMEGPSSYNLWLAFSPQKSWKNWKETSTTRGRFGICSTVILKPQEFGDGNVPEKTGKGEGKGTPRPQLQSEKFKSPPWF